MSYAEAVMERITELREARIAAQDQGQHVMAENLQKAINALYDRYAALTGDID